MLSVSNDGNGVESYIKYDFKKGQRCLSGTLPFALESGDTEIRVPFLFCCLVGDDFGGGSFH